MFTRLSARVRLQRSHRAIAALLSASALGACAYHSSDAFAFPRHTVYAATAPSPARAPFQVEKAAAASPSPLPTSSSAPDLNAPPREESLKKLKRADHVYDVLIIGGGYHTTHSLHPHPRSYFPSSPPTVCSPFPLSPPPPPSATGSGIALDCALRGLSTSLVEASDFSSGASSRSTKLIHGGIRYLQKAFTQMDVHQYTMVKEALAERRHLLAIAPHLAHSFPIIVPIYTSFPAILFYAPYYWVGCKLYDTVAGRAALLSPSYFLTPSQALLKFPTLKPDRLWGGMVYYDGQHNDTRMNLGIVLTAAAHGVDVANHVRVVGLLKEGGGGGGGGRVVGAHVRDELTGEEWDVRAKAVVNATGPLTDSVRHMADPTTPSCITPSAGVHVVLPASYSPPDMGLIVPETSDGRVLFMLPWEGSTVVGTTDYLSPVTALPKPGEADVEFVLREVGKLLRVEVDRKDIRSVWSGIRPLAKDVKAKDTQSVNRDHIVERTADGLLTITGGKWTTYRKMAEDTVDALLTDQAELAQRAAANSTAASSSPSSSPSAVNPAWLIDTAHVQRCRTWGFPLIGTAGYTPELTEELIRSKSHLLPASSSPTTSPSAVLRHLTHNYGDRALVVLDVAQATSDFSLLSLEHPFLTAEVLYACRYEYAMTVTDVLAHRTRLSFLDTKAAEGAVGKVVGIMSRWYGWDEARKRKEVKEAKAFLDTMKASADTLQTLHTPHADPDHSPALAAA